MGPLLKVPQFMGHSCSYSIIHSAEHATPGQGDDVQLHKKLPGSVDASEGLEQPTQYPFLD